MLNFFVNRRYAYTFSIFALEWASPRFREVVKIIPYDRLPLIMDILPGTFVFSDLERLNSLQLNVLETFCDQLVSADADISIINHPKSVLNRYNLLRALYEAGINKYNVYPATDSACSPQYPIFLRMTNDHKGPLTDLLYNTQQRDAKLLQTAMQGFDTKHMLQVEFCETKGQDGLYRKYSAFRFGADQIIPGHMIFARDWIAKDGDPPDTHTLQESERYLQQNPHADKLMEIFELAGITYGRIDYSILAGNIQTWEINTNPILIKPRKEYKAELLEIKARLAKVFEKYILAMDHYGSEKRITSKAGQAISIEWDSAKYFS